MVSFSHVVVSYCKIAMKSLSYVAMYLL